MHDERTAAPDGTAVRSASWRAMRAGGLVLLAAFSVLAAVACAAGPRIEPSIRIPGEFTEPAPEPPTGESQAVQYRKAYEAFWYNCVTLRSENLAARCPTNCRGTPAATAGCARGGEEASSRIGDSVAAYGESRTRRVLQETAAQIEIQAKMAAYFGEHPVEDYASDRR